MTDPKALRPRYGESVGTAQGGRVVFSGSFNKFIDSILSRLSALTVSEKAETSGRPARAAAFVKNEFAKLDRVSRVITGNYTTEGSEFLKITADCTITFHSDPDNGDRVTGYNANGSRITYATPGQEDVISVRKGTTLDFVYYVDINEWVIE